MRGENIQKNGIQTTYGPFDFLVMYFVLTNSLVEFMDLMNIVFRSYIDSSVIIFIEHIFVYSKNEVVNTWII